MDNQTPPPETMNDPAAVTQASEEQTVIDWKSTLDENIRNHPSLGNVKDISTLAKNYVNAQELIGKKGVILPSKPDDEEGWNRVFKELGRPEDASKYVKPKIEVEDDFKAFLDESKFDKFAEIAHKYGLNQKQFEAISKEYTELQLKEIKDIVSAENKSKEEAMSKLMNEWGLDYDSKNSLAEKLLKSIGSDIPQERLEQYKSDPFIKKMFASIASKISEDKLVASDSAGALSKGEIKAEISRLMGDKNGSYWNVMAVDHKETVEKVKNMYEALEKAN